MANAPKCPDHGRPHAVALIAYDGRDGNDVIGIGGMAHSQKKSHGENGEKSDHVFHVNRLLAQRGQLYQSHRAKYQRFSTG